MTKNRKIKKEIKFDSLVIRLYFVIEKNIPGAESVANIQAFDSQGKLIWTVEPPTFSFHYFDMQIDEDERLMEADSGAGTLYKINLTNGRIISSHLIK